MSRGAAELVSCWLASVRKVLGGSGLWLDRDNVARHLRVLRFVGAIFTTDKGNIFSIVLSLCGFHEKFLILQHNLFTYILQWPIFNSVVGVWLKQLM
jgi:hypothetical protein